jgi:hypothetical protein
MNERFILHIILKLYERVYDINTRNNLKTRKITMEKFVVVFMFSSKILTRVVFGKEVRKDAFRLHGSVSFKKLYIADILPYLSFALRAFAAVCQTNFFCLVLIKTKPMARQSLREVSQFVD